MSTEITYQHVRGTRAGPEDSAALFVSLYVVILAFFILLAANSQFDVEKTQAATKSMKKAFSIETLSETRIKVPQIGSEISVTQFFAEVKNSVQSLVPADEMEVITDGNVMTITMPSTAMFNRDDPHLRHDRRDLYTRLSDTLTKWRGGMQMQLSFLQSPSKRGAEPAPTLQITRGGNFARYMENHGAPAHNLSIAIQSGDDDTITLIFDVVTLDANKLDFAEPEAEAKPATPKGPIPLSGVKGEKP